VRIPFREHLVQTLTVLALCEVGIASLGAIMLAEPAHAQLSEKAMKQIEMMEKEKDSRSPVQQKIDSQLLYEIQKKSGHTIKGVPAMKTGIEPDKNGRVLVDIKAKVTADLVQQIKGVGGEVITSSEKTIRSNLPMSQVEPLAGNDNITFIGPAVQGQTQKSISRVEEGLPQPKAVSLASKEFLRPNALPSQQLPGVLTKLAQVGIADAGGAAINTGIKSQGDAAHGADLARKTFGVTGAGVKIGVLSDSYNCRGGAQGDINSGDLPSDGVNVIQEGNCAGPTTSGVNSDEGRAMLQIIHDLAPSSTLYFASATVGTPDDFAKNIRALKAAGCDVIVDDFLYFNESPFQDDVVSQAVSDVVRDQALYFSFAGNYGNLKNNTSETWEGDFVGQPGNTPAGTFIVHNFGNGITSNVITPSANPVQANLFWSDPLGASANDYDLYIFDKADTMLTASVMPQNGSQDPYESVLAIPKLGDKIVVVKKGGEDRYLHLDVLGKGTLAVGTSGGMRGHATVEGAFGVAATNVATASRGRFTGGAANPVENVSSDGPRRIFYNSDGTPITPGNLLSTGGKVRDKPDITAADGVATTLPASSGLNPFFGTSAAAPHAAAIAALVKSLNPALTQDQVRTALTSTALDIEAPGVDLNAGAGIVDAFQALTLVSGRQPQ
jgi:Subtilase family